MKRTPIEKYCERVYCKRRIGPLNPYPLIKALASTQFQKYFTFKIVYEISHGQESQRCCSKDDLIGMVFDKYSTGNQVVYDVYLDMVFSFIVVYMKKWENGK